MDYSFKKVRCKTPPGESRRILIIHSHARPSVSPPYSTTN